MVRVAIIMDRCMCPRPVTYERHTRYANSLFAFLRHGQVPTLAGGYHSHSGSSQSSENSMLSKMVPVVASVSKKQKLHVPFCPFHTPSITGSNPLLRIWLLRSFMGTFLQSKAICCTPPSPRLLVKLAHGLHRESIHLPGLSTPPSDCLRPSAA